MYGPLIEFLYDVRTLQITSHPAEVESLVWKICDRYVDTKAPRSVFIALAAEDHQSATLDKIASVVRGRTGGGIGSTLLRAVSNVSAEAALFSAIAMFV